MKTIVLLTLLALQTIHAFNPPTTTTNIPNPNRSRPPSSTQQNLYNSVENAIVEAQSTCYENGQDSQGCKVAWDIVEELEAADSHRDNAAAVVASSWEEKQVNYLPLLEGMDVLSNKLEKKLCELRNLSEQLAQGGAGEEIERLVYASEEMIGLLESAREKVRELKQY
jgi:hypothetical protein